MDQAVRGGLLEWSVLQVRKETLATLELWVLLEAEGAAEMSEHRAHLVNQAPLALQDPQDLPPRFLKTFLLA